MIKRGAMLGAALVLLLFSADEANSSEGARGLRVVSLAPSSTEILFALGLDDEIVGVSQFCDFPRKAASKERIGTFSDPNIEKILALKPDVVFCTGLEQGPVITKLRQLGLKVCVSDPSDMEELYGSIREIGGLVRRDARAGELINEMRSLADGVRKSVAAVPQDKRPKVFVEIWNNPMMTAGKGSIVDDIITIAGGRNIAYDTGLPYGSFSSEEVLRRDPDVIIVTYMQKSDSLKAVGDRLGWANITAVRQRRVYNDIDSSILLRPGPRIVDGLIKLHKRIYLK